MFTRIWGDVHEVTIGKTLRLRISMSHKFSRDFSLYFRNLPNGDLCIAVMSPPDDL